MCEPQVFGLRAGLSLAKLPSDGRAGGPRLGLDTSLSWKSMKKTCFQTKDDIDRPLDRLNLLSKIA